MQTPADTARGSVLFTARVAAVVGTLAPALWLQLALTRDDRRAHRCIQSYCRTALSLVGCTVRIGGLEHLPSGSPVMFVANHSSMADAVVLMAALPFDFRFIANHVSATYPLLGVAIRHASHHIVDRGSWRSRADCGQSMVDALARGQSLLVFPEGTTPDHGEMLPFRSGAFRAAAKIGTPIVPVAIRGTRQLFPPGAALLAPATVQIDVLPPLRAEDGNRHGVARLRDRAAETIREWLSLQAAAPMA